MIIKTTLNLLGIALMLASNLRAETPAKASGISEAKPARLKRADSYFGIHFDFHAGNDCTEIGKNTTRQMIENIITNVRPDYIQIDCKGHPGLSSYPTKVGNQAPGFVGDPLRLWREVTAEHGVALYMHYSGVWDSEAIRKHPDWGAVNADGTTNGNATSFFAPYDEQLLIPQLRELTGDYGVDGAWVDGECWASVPDYSAPALKAWHAVSGWTEAPRGPGQPHWREFLDFNREAFRNHLRFYVAGVKKLNPQAQLCSNWAFTDHMPEAVCATVDWISGDFTPEDAVNSARFSARYIAQQGKPWDLMAWTFTTTPYRLNGSRQKPAIQLEQEAAVVLSLGGGFQPYYNQRRDGSVPLEHVPTIAEVAQFCRTRQPFCQGATAVPQIALLYSTASHYREIDSLFGRDLSRMSGTLQALIESQQTMDLVSEHHLQGRMAQYPLIIVAECDHLEPEFKSALLHYVENGGNLLILGPQAASLFASELGVTLGPPLDGPLYLATDDALVETCDQIRAAKLEQKARPIGRLHATRDTQSTVQPAASLTILGKGKIAATYFSFSRGYLRDRSPARRAFLRGLVHDLFPSPMVEVTGSPYVDVSVMRRGEALSVNLVNTSGPHADPKQALFDSISPLGPLVVKVRLPQKPAKITLEPEHQPLEFSFEAGAANLTVPKVGIHSIVRVE